MEDSAIHFDFSLRNISYASPWRRSSPHTQTAQILAKHSSIMLESVFIVTRPTLPLLQRIYSKIVVVWGVTQAISVQGAAGMKEEDTDHRQCNVIENI